MSTCFKMLETSLISMNKIIRNCTKVFRANSTISTRTSFSKVLCRMKRCQKFAQMRPRGAIAKEIFSLGLKVRPRSFLRCCRNHINGRKILTRITLFADEETSRRIRCQSSKRPASVTLRELIQRIRFCLIFKYSMPLEKNMKPKLVSMLCKLRRNMLKRRLRPFPSKPCQQRRMPKAWKRLRSSRPNNMLRNH